MVYGRFCREVRPPTRRPGLLQGGWPEPSHNPRGHILRPRLHPPRLDVLGPGRGEPDGCRGWVLRSEETHLEHFSISARSAPRRATHASTCEVKNLRPLGFVLRRLTADEGVTVELVRA